jgi:hypothetical protein
MGRKLRRVPMDFAWPLKETWQGYLNPYSAQMPPCPDCEGSGYSLEARLLENLWYHHLHLDALELTNRHYDNLPEALRDFAAKVLFSHSDWASQLDQEDVQALINEGRLWDFTRRPRTPEQAAAHEAYQTIAKAKGVSGYWMPEDNGYIPTAEEVNAWSRHGLGHDAINRMICIEARCKRYRVEVTCATCEGFGDIASPELRKLYDEWVPEDPPEGQGYQLWETTGEGSPISPVFETLRELCEWAEGNATTFGHFRASAGEWERMLGENDVYHQEGNNIFI